MMASSLLSIVSPAARDSAARDSAARLSVAKLIEALGLTLLLSCTVHSTSVAADPNANDKKNIASENAEPTGKKVAKSAQKTTDKKSNRRSIDPDMEREVLQMVDHHLPDIKILLDQLRSKNQSQYGTAIRTLAKSAKRLEAAKKRSEESFEIEVEVVKAQSSVNLLVAKLRIRDNPKDRNALRQAAQQIHGADLARDRHEFAVWQERLKKMQHQVRAIEQRISDKESNATKRIESSFKAHLRKAGIKD